VSAAAQLVQPRAHTQPLVRHRVLLVLLLAALPAVLGLAFVSVAPNRLVSGAGVPLVELMSGARHALWAPVAVLAAAVFMPTSRAVQAVVAVAAALLLVGLCWLAGHEAALQSATRSSLARVSLGGGFWVLVLLAWLAACDALQRLGLSPAWRTLAYVGVLLPVTLLLLGGQLDDLSLLKEYANRREVFDAAFERHLQIVFAALLPALAIGVPLGVAAARNTTFATPLFAALNIIQTVPSIALFALLIAPVGVGLAPAAMALTLYALLPVVHGTASGLAQVPAAAVEAAEGMGMTAFQVFWRVRVPLALPVLLSGLRVTTVQIIGLAVVAALIGAGGFGALVFQGLASTALDLVLLGVLPVVVLAVAADAALGLLAAAAAVAAGGPAR
jgi:osmoprotectant transport system permease protein